MHSIEINGKTYCASVSKDNWVHGISVLVSISDGKQPYFSAKVSSSASASDSYDQVSNLSTEELLERAWQQFKMYYPFDKLEETVNTGIVVLLPWR